jgi:L-amino acid N-acyltransferase YncA
MIVRPASMADLPRITEIHNYYVQNTHIVLTYGHFRRSNASHGLTSTLIMDAIACS